MEQKISLPTAEGGLAWKINHFQPNQPNGFSAPLFKQADTHRKVLAVRGSIGLNDIKSDIDLIFKNGIAAVQIVDMVNYWQSLITPQGQTYRAARLTVSATETAARQALAANLAGRSACNESEFKRAA